MSIVNFVPVVVSPSPPSPRAEQLGQRLAEVIRQYREQFPETSGLELRQALRIALLRAGGGNRAPARLVALALALAAAAGLLGVALARPRAGGPSWMLALVVGVLLVGIGLVALVRGRQT